MIDLTKTGSGESLFDPNEYSLEKLLTPLRTALLVVDAQNDFCSPEGYFAKHDRPVDQMADAIQKTQYLIDAAHKYGVKIIFTKGYEDVKYRGESGRRRAVKWGEVDSEGRELVEVISSKSGTFGADFFEVSPDDAKGDIILEKYEWSAFTGHNAEGKNLKALLDNESVKTLVVTGVVAETCVETTIRDAYTRDYIVIVPRDCVGSNFPEQLSARMQYWEKALVSEVMEKENIAKIWENSRPS